MTAHRWRTSPSTDPLPLRVRDAAIVVVIVTFDLFWTAVEDGARRVWRR